MLHLELERLVTNSHEIQATIHCPGFFAGLYLSELVPYLGETATVTATAPWSRVLPS